MKPRVVIIGAGISGLTLGWTLRQRLGTAIDLDIFEKSPRPGGWIRSSTLDGFFFEHGPRSCRSKGSGQATLQLIEALGLQEETIAASPAARHRYLYAGGHLHKLPENAWEFCCSPLTKGIVPVLLKEWFRSQGDDPDESIKTFIERRFSSEVAERLVDPLATGIYAGDIERLSMAACFPTIWQMEQKHGSIGKALFKRLWAKRSKKTLSPFVARFQATPLFSLRNGMEQLPQALAAAMGKDLHLGQGVQSIGLKGQQLEIELEDGRLFPADRVFLAVPAKATAALLPFLPDGLKRTLSALPMAAVGVVHVGWNKAVLPRQGFGYLVPSREQQEVLGMVWDSSAFPQQNRHTDQTRLTAMVGGAKRPDMLQWTDDRLITLIVKTLKNHLGISERPDTIAITRAERAIPQYERGHLETLDAIETALREAANGSFTILGSAWKGVSVNDCIAEAREVGMVYASQKTQGHLN